MLSKVIFNMAKRTVSFKFKDRLLASSIPVQALTTAEAKSKLKWSYIHGPKSWPAYLTKAQIVFDITVKLRNDKNKKTLLYFFNTTKIPMRVRIKYF